MDIGEVAERAGMAPSALRFYEEAGLIRSVGRRGLRRQYGPEVLDRLALIALGRAAGLRLEEIGRMLSKGPRPAVDRAVLGARAAELDRQLKSMTAIRDLLVHAAACPVADQLDCPRFRRLMGLAVARAAAKRRKRRPPGHSR